MCLERPNVAFFLTHALRELQAFVESLQLRVDHSIKRPEPPGDVATEEPKSCCHRRSTCSR